MKNGVVCGVFLAAAIMCSGAFGGEDGGSGIRTGTLRHRITLEAEYPVTGQGKVDRVIQQWLEKRLEDALESFAAVGLDPDFTESEVTLGVKYRESKPSEKAVSYIFELFSYPSRAAHPMTRAYVLNIDLERREQLKLDDVFAHPKRALRIMAERAPKAVMKDLTERLAGKMDAKEVEGALFMEGFEAKRDNYRALSLEPDGVRVTFQLYQVAPYVFGKPEAFIPLSDLEEAEPRIGLWGK